MNTVWGENVEAATVLKRLVLVNGVVETWGEDGMFEDKRGIVDAGVEKPVLVLLLKEKVTGFVLVNSKAGAVLTTGGTGP